MFLLTDLQYMYPPWSSYHGVNTASILVLFEWFIDAFVSFSLFFWHFFYISADASPNEKCNISVFTGLRMWLLVHIFTINASG